MNPRKYNFAMNDPFDMDADIKLVLPKLMSSNNFMKSIRRYEVYKNPYMTENVILMGYRGSQFLETGAVFAPYIPLIMTPLVYDPDTFTPRKGLLTRYAKKMIRPEFYGRVFVNDLATV